MASTRPKKDGEPTLYDVLALTPQNLEGQDPQAQRRVVKQAYRRALLKHHPDKSHQNAKSQPDGGLGNAAKHPAAGGTPSTKTDLHFTVDQITEAYTVLSDAKQRRDYNNNNNRSQQQRQYSRTATTTQHFSFQTGVETVDLDDLKWDGKRMLYYRSCRCGQRRGYCFREDDLDDAGDAGELMVECAGCSLWLRVLFEEEEDEDEDGDADGVPPYQDRASSSSSGGVQAQPQAQPPTRTQSQAGVARSGSAAGPKASWSWNLNIGISIGGGLGASLGARTSRS